MGIAPELTPKCRDQLDEHPKITCSIGFCQREQKWYGWSHRAIYGFGIGSTIKKGDCGYTSSNADEQAEDYVQFFSFVIEGDDDKANKNREEYLAKNRNMVVPVDDMGIYVIHSAWKERFGGIPLIAPNDLIDVLIGKATPEERGLDLPDDFGAGVSFYPVGRGEWTARTLDDARQMAIDFAEDVA